MTISATDRQWMADFIKSPTAIHAFGMAIAATPSDQRPLATDYFKCTNFGESSKIALRLASDLTAHRALSCAWYMLGLRAIDEDFSQVIDLADDLIGTTDDESTKEAWSRLEVWRAVKAGKLHVSTDLFDAAEKFWRDQLRIRSGADIAVEMLWHDRWDDAREILLEATKSTLKKFNRRLPPQLPSKLPRSHIRNIIVDFVDDLFGMSTPETGQLALAWQMMMVDPLRQESFVSVMPQLQHALDRAFITRDEERAQLNARIGIWWRAAEGEFVGGAPVSIFCIADVECRHQSDAVDIDPLLQPVMPARAHGFRKPSMPKVPSLVVMSLEKSTKLNSSNLPFKPMVDAALPLVIARDIARIRSTLLAEYPHALAAVDLVLRDLREGKPVTLKPLLLVGDPGCGKSRLVRRLGDLLGAFLYRYDASSSADNQFGGTSKAWGNSEASIPARACLQSMTANPIIMVDEIEKSSLSSHHGRLIDVILPFLEKETAARYRDQSLDAELDLSRLSYIATANDDAKLPAPLKDRFRIIRVPTPALMHLPALASQVMRDLAISDENRAHDEPLAEDELAIIGQAWKRARFSMRSLQKIVTATLETRDSYAPRH